MDKYEESRIYPKEAKFFYNGKEIPSDWILDYVEVQTNTYYEKIETCKHTHISNNKSKLSIKIKKEFKKHFEFELKLLKNLKLERKDFKVIFNETQDKLIFRLTKDVKVELDSYSDVYLFTFWCELARYHVHTGEVLWYPSFENVY